ncbi:hypothetical protein SRB17_87620 [Streptomyces sp. RB17]|nr:hypothetical protein [Streptomyces sp. RB17]
MGIGDLAARTGLPVKTIRYYSDIGLLPESGRSQPPGEVIDSEKLKG